MNMVWIKLLPILPICLEGILFFICGIYQLLTGKESFLISGYAKKYNYKQRKREFIKASGILDIISGIFVAILLPAVYFYHVSVMVVLFLSIPFICLLASGQHIMVRLYTNNLENRKY